LAQWEVETTNGSLGEAVVLDEAATGYAEDAGNHLILAHVKSDRPLKYLAGAGWTRSGDFTTKEDWLAYVAAAAARAKSPINVTLSAH
jgi:pectinesterase